MTNHSEKRHSIRHPIGGPISLQPPIRTTKEMSVNLLNFSEQGICFSTDNQLIPGTTVLFKASKDNYVNADNDADYQLRSISMVTVKWCKEGVQKNRPIHIIGATYLIPY